MWYSSTSKEMQPQSNQENPRLGRYISVEDYSKTTTFQLVQKLTKFVNCHSTVTWNRSKHLHLFSFDYLLDTLKYINKASVL